MQNDPGAVRELTFRLTIPGDPVPWQSFQHGGQRRNRKTGEWEDQLGYDNLKVWQAQIQLYLRKAWGNKEPLKGPVTLRCEFYLPWPDSAPQHNPKAIEKWWQKHRTMKPDRTNLYKAFEDACEGILFVGDQQTLRGESRKELLNPNYWVHVKEGYTRVWFGSLEDC